MAFANLADEELIEDFLAGNDTAFEALVLRYEDRVYRLAYRLSGNHDDASDLAQDAFLKVYRFLKQWRGQAAFSTWLYRIVSNTYLDDVRKQRRRPLTVVSLDAVVTREDGDLPREFPADELGPEEIYLQREVEQVMQAALMKLAPDYRVMLTLRDVAGHSYEEISEITGLKLGTVKSRLSRARAALRTTLLGMEQYSALWRQ